MRARDIMTEEVVTVRPHASVREIASLLLERRISAVPVVDNDGDIIGIVSEGDLIHRSEIGTETRGHSWWLRLFEDTVELAERYTKAHGATARDVMTREVVTVDETASLGEIAELLETRHIKRVPVTRNGALVGIVSRANLLRALAASPQAAPEAVGADDQAIRDRIVDRLRQAPWGSAWNTSVFVKDGVVEFWGTVESDAAREASRIAAMEIPGVKEVHDKRGSRLISGI